MFDNRIIINYDYERLKDNVMPGEMKPFLTDMQKIDDSQDYQLSWNDERDNVDTGISTKAMVNVIVILLIVISLIVRWTQKR